MHFNRCCDAYQKKEIRDKWYLEMSMSQISQCYMSISLFDQQKSPSEKIDLMNKAEAKFKDTIELLKKNKNKEVFKCQHQLARCLYNKDAIMTGLARDGSISYSEQQKQEVRSSMRAVLDTAFQGARAASNMVEMQQIQNLRNLQFN